MALLAKRRCIISKPGLVDRNRNRQILTRLQALRIAETFPFLALPAELRILVYTFALTFAGIESWFEAFWNVLQSSSKPLYAIPPPVYKGTPAVLLICKQIYHEAREILYKQSSSFHHGLLDVWSLDSIMNTNILSKVTSITIDAKGHAILPKTKSLVGPSWRGHLDLIVELSDILEKGHHLKTFTLDLTDRSIHNHVHECWGRAIRCDFRDQLAEALRHLRRVRNVPHVILRGVPKAMIANLQARMQSSPLTFLDLPGEIRNHIYTYCADWSDISVQLGRVLESWPVAAAPSPFRTITTQQTTFAPTYPARSTPTVLLLNKAIYAEAKSILYAKPLRLHLPEHPKLQNAPETLNAIKLISPLTLAQVEHLDIRVDSWEWVYALDRFVLNLAEKHHLKTFKFSFRDSLKQTFLTQDRPYPDRTLHLSLSGLARVRGVSFVDIAGDLPAVYTTPLKSIMEAPAVPGEVLPVLKGVKKDGEKDLLMVDVDEAE